MWRSEEIHPSPPLEKEGIFVSPLLKKGKRVAPLKKEGKRYVSPLRPIDPSIFRTGQGRGLRVNNRGGLGLAAPRYPLLNYNYCTNGKASKN
jgi:hypothetical protein